MEWALSVRIASPPPVVWRVLSDVESWPEHKAEGTGQPWMITA